MPSLSSLTKKSSLSYSSSSSALSYSASSVSSLSSSASSVSDGNSSINDTIIVSHRMPINTANISNIVTETENNDFQQMIYDQATHNMYNRLMKRRYNNNGQAPAQQNMNMNNNSTKQIPSDICFIAKDTKKNQTEDMPFPMDL